MIKEDHKNILVVGTGSIGSRHIENLIKFNCNVGAYSYRKENLSKIKNIAYEDTLDSSTIGKYDGVVIANEMANGPVVAFMGTKLFSNNLSINEADVIRPKAGSTPLDYAQSSSEYEVQLGGWVVNGGSDSANAILNAKITFGGTTLYDQTSAPSPLGSGDSAYFAFPTFNQASYSAGMYNLTYSVDTTGDEFQSDNMVSQNFHISNSKFSNVTLDSDENMNLGAFYRPSDAVGSISMCAPFMDPNASRMAAMGISFAASTGSGDSLTGKFFSVQAWEWNDVFVDMDDPAVVTDTDTPEDFENFLSSKV